MDDSTQRTNTKPTPNADSAGESFPAAVTGLTSLLRWVNENDKDLPYTVGIETARQVLGLGRSKAYEMARNSQFPCRVIRCGRSFLVPTYDLLATIGIDPLALVKTDHDAQKSDPDRAF